MAKCILHIGMIKTGTTSIQASLRALSDRGFYYAKLLKSPNHSMALYAAFSEDAAEHGKINRMLSQSGDIEALRRSVKRGLKTSIRDAEGRTLVISGEGIPRLSSDELHRLRKFLARQGYDDIDVVAYIRPPGAYISSAMQQRIKVGTMARFQPEICKPNYRDSFSKFDDLFGVEKVNYFKFDPSVLYRQDVVLDFCQRTGIPESSISLTRQNESITKLATQLIYQYTRFRKAEGLPKLGRRAGETLNRAIEKLDPQRFRLSPLVLAPILRQIGDDIEWMERRLGQPLGERLGDELETDVRSEQDLLDPPPGINDKLAELLGEGRASAGTSTTCQLIHLLTAGASQTGGKRTSGSGKRKTSAAFREDAIQ